MMKNPSLGMAAAAVTVLVGLGGYWIQAEAPTLARSTGLVLIDGAAVKGRIETRDDGVYGVIEWTNSTDHVVEGHLVHAAFMTPGASPLSRMMPHPQLIHTATNQFVLGGGEADVWEFLIQPTVASEVGTATPAAAPVPQPATFRSSPTVWSLVISRESIMTPEWGGMLPMPQTDRVLGEAGQLILAHGNRPVAAGKPEASSPTPVAL